MASPTWWTAISPGTWGTLPNSVLSSSGVMLTNGDRVISKWGGGVIVTGGLYIGSTFTSGNFLVIWGGGHTDYSGNELYAYGPLEDDSPVWYRLRDATSPAPDDVETDGSGNPVSRHTYAALSYINDGTRNWLVSIGSYAAYHSSNSYTHALAYNFGQVSPNSNQPWSVKATTDVSIVTAYNSVTNRIWYRKKDQNNVAYYDVATDTVTSDDFKTTNANDNAAAAMDTARGIFASWDGTNGIEFFDTNGGVANDYYVPTTTGTAPTGQGGILYDSRLDAFLIWVDGGKQLWKLTPPSSSPYQGGNAWTWSNWTPSGGSTPDAAAVGGTFGRFNWVAKTDVLGYILLNNATGSIYFYKPDYIAPAGGVPTRQVVPSYDLSRFANIRSSSFVSDLRIKRWF